MLYSASFPAINGAVEAVKAELIKISRKPKGDYTDKPQPAYLGPHPGKWAHHRGGLWTDRQLAAVAQAHLASEYADSVASTKYVALQHASSDADSGGPALPWEGTLPSSGGTMNTSNGNKLTEIPLFEWKQRGGFPIKFSLYQNSESGVSGGPGYGWRSSFEITISTSAGYPIVT